MAACSRGTDKGRYMGVRKGGGSVPVAPVSMGALVQQRETTKQQQQETCVFRENVKMCARTKF
jgi:hypothetical protein